MVSLQDEKNDNTENFWMKSRLYTVRVPWQCKKVSEQARKSYVTRYYADIESWIKPALQNKEIDLNPATFDLVRIITKNPRQGNTKNCYFPPGELNDLEKKKITALIFLLVHESSPPSSPPLSSLHLQFPPLRFMRSLFFTNILTPDPEKGSTRRRESRTKKAKRRSHWRRNQRSVE